MRGTHRTVNPHLTKKLKNMSSGFIWRDSLHRITAIVLTDTGLKAKHKHAHILSPETEQTALAEYIMLTFQNTGKKKKILGFLKMKLKRWLSG